MSTLDGINNDVVGAVDKPLNLLISPGAANVATTDAAQSALGAAAGLAPSDNPSIAVDRGPGPKNILFLALVAYVYWCWRKK